VPKRFPILHDLKAEGATDYFALPVKSALGTNYTVTYATDRIGGFTAQEISDLTRASQRPPLLADLHSQRRIASNILTAYLGPKTGRKFWPARSGGAPARKSRPSYGRRICAGSPSVPTASPGPRSSQCSTCCSMQKPKRSRVTTVKS
jgi:hypothetical protein